MTIPANTTAPTALQMLEVLDSVLSLDDSTQGAAADLIGSVAESFRNANNADEESKATAGVLEHLCRLIRIARADMAALEGGTE